MNSMLIRCLFLLPLLVSAIARAQAPAMAADAELVETRRQVPLLKAPAAYEPKDNIVEVELSEYAGYAGLVAANGGLEPSENSYFFKKHGFKVKLTLSEEESWSALNSGKMAASATTTDVLAVYGKQFDVVVPALIGYSRGADGVVVRSEVKKINDLKGKTLSCSQFTESDFFIRYLATEAGLEVNLLDDLKSKPDPDKVNLVFCQDGFGAGDLFLRDLKAKRNRLAGCVTWAPKTTEVAEGSGGAARVLATNTNLLIIADILIVNKGFAQAHPKMLAGLVDGLMAGNDMVRKNPKQQLEVIGKAMKWTPDEAQAELAKVHLANVPENIAFFNGTIDSAGSWGFIYESAVAAYGKSLIPAPASEDDFLSLGPIKALADSGAYKDQKAQVLPIKSASNVVEQAPLLSKNIRFLFEPNTATLNMNDKANLANLESLQHTLRIAPGSTILLRGHAEPSLIEKYRVQGGEALVCKVALTAMQLSKDRAAAVAKVLADKYGIDAARIKSIGRGWEEPISKDPAENRRVEMQWFTME